jgi:hypothetical protein
MTAATTLITCTAIAGPKTSAGLDLPTVVNSSAGEATKNTSRVMMSSALLPRM